MQLPENQNKKYDHLFTEIDTGYIKIPKFIRVIVIMYYHLQDFQITKL